VTSPFATTVPARHPLLAQLVTRHAFVEVTGDTFDAFVRTPGHVLLLFTEDPARYKETLDLAVIAPEIVRAFPERFTAGVFYPEAARACAGKFGFRRWPALVLVKDGGYVGAIDGLRDWDEYLHEIARLLDAPVSRPPSIGVVVNAANAGDAEFPQ
jgi:hydrogenase-1 operon protein HyaE